jgi:hypothetical protein
MRKTLPINSTKDGFPVIPQELNRHYRDLRRLQQTSNPTQQPPDQENKQGKLMYAIV